MFGNIHFLYFFSHKSHEIRQKKNVRFIFIILTYTTQPRYIKYYGAPKMVCA